MCWYKHHFTCFEVRCRCTLSSSITTTLPFHYHPLSSASLWRVWWLCTAVMPIGMHSSCKMSVLEANTASMFGSPLMATKHSLLSLPCKLVLDLCLCAVPQDITSTCVCMFVCVYVCMCGGIVCVVTVHIDMVWMQFVEHWNNSNRLLCNIAYGSVVLVYSHTRDCVPSPQHASVLNRN